MTMLLISVLMFLVMREIWCWSLPANLLVASLFIVVAVDRGTSRSDSG
jgi:K+ transporter